MLIVRGKRLGLAGDQVQEIGGGVILDNP